MDPAHSPPTKPDHAIKLVEKLYRFATRSKHTDFLIKAAGATVQCHSPVLCAQSPFIDGLCATGASEATIKFQQPTAQAKQALEQTRRYLYLGTLQLNEDIIEPVLVIAQKMDHEALLDECEKFMMSTLNVSKCQNYCEAADRFHLVHLSRACQELKIAKFSLLINEPWFLPILSVHDLIRFLSDDQLGVSSEDEALDAVSKWLRQCAALEKHEEFTEMLVPHVRLNMCDQKKLEAAVEPINTSTPSALKVRILHFLHKKDVRVPEYPRGQTEEVTVIVGGRKEGNIGHHQILYPDTKRSSVPFPDALECSFYSVCREGSTLYLSGGYSYSQKKKSMSTVYQFCCERGTMEEISSLPCARNNHGSARVGNRLYIFGGCYREGDDIKTWHRIVHVLDLASMTWSTVRDLPYGVENPAVVVIDQLIFLLGGWLEEGGCSRKLVKYEPHTDTWTACRDMPQVKQFCINSTVPVGTDIYVLARDKFLCYNTKGDQWSSLDAPPMPSSWTSLVHDNGALVVSGGYETSEKHPHNRRQRFDLRSRKWSLLDDTLPLALSYHFSFVVRVPKSS